MSKSHKKSLYKIILAFVFLILGVAVQHGPSIFPTYSEWIYILLYIISYIICGYETILSAVKGIFRGQMLDENFLMTIASVGAMFLGEYTEGVAVMLFFQIGELFEKYATGKSRESIASLMDIRPDYANLYDDITKTSQVVDPYDIEVGSLIQIKPGEKVAIDGIIQEGSSSIHTAALTGESIPRDVCEGDEVLSGSINMTGVIILKTTKHFDESTASKILELVENAADNKAATERFITKFARFYTPAVVEIAVLLALVPPLFFPGESFSKWIYTALTFLVISCPCALVISIPLSFFGGIGGASKQGILVKGSNYLEALSRTETIIFDKTGTLTTGEFKVSQVEIFKDGTQTAETKSNFIHENQLLKLAAHVELHSSHPIAMSIKTAFKEKPNPKAVTDVNDLSGYGILAKINMSEMTDDEMFDKATDICGLGKVYNACEVQDISNHDALRINDIDDITESSFVEVAVGNIKLMEKLGKDVAERAINHSKKQALSETLVYIAIAGSYVGFIAIGDSVKPEATESMSALKAVGVKKTTMLTGDVAETAKKVAETLGIDEVHSNLLPSDKLSKLEELLGCKKQKSTIVYVGDGINDAPVLARADVGIAMGAAGSDAAINAADAVIMGDNLLKLAKLISISKKTVKIAKQNIILALGIKGIVMLLGVLHIATMWSAVFADVGVAIIAILNATRALR